LCPSPKSCWKYCGEYYKTYKPKFYLFEGQNGDAYSTRSVQEVLKVAKAKAGICKKGSTHSLRHTFATHTLENGTDIRYIQELLGHTNIKTTMRYTHIAQKQIRNIQSPLDRLNL
jgi:site-specific recombinase XerD